MICCSNFEIRTYLTNKPHLPSFNSCLISFVLWKFISSKSCSKAVGVLSEELFANAIFNTISFPFSKIHFLYNLHIFPRFFTLF